MPNHPGELWTIFRAIWPEVPRALGITNHDQWMRRFCRFTPTQFGPYVYGSKNTHLLKPYLKTIMLRRTLEDVGIELPPLRVNVSLLPRDNDFQRALDEYGGAESYERAMTQESDESGSRSRLRRLVGEYKAPRIGDIIAEELRTDQYRKIVVLWYHHSVGQILTQKLKKYGVVGFDGGTSQRARQFSIDVFRDDPSVRVFSAQATAAGVAINLQIASEIVVVEPARTPEDDYQAVKRIHRIGTTHPCRARLFAVAGTYDETILRGRANKIQMINDLGLGREERDN
jgi:SNF2 family DNA or RNA helicase